MDFLILMFTEVRARGRWKEALLSLWQHNESQPQAFSSQSCTSMNEYNLHYASLVHLDKKSKGMAEIQNEKKENKKLILN